MAEFSGYVTPADLTLAQARVIRSWRVDDEMSYRAVAQAATDAWGSDFGSNQLYGEDLCRAAAVVLGEDFNSEAWQGR